MKPYVPPILVWVFIAISILTALPALVILVFAVFFSGSSILDAALFLGVILPVAVCAIVVLGIAQLVDCMGRTSHYTQQMAELLFRELSSIRKELVSGKEKKDSESGY